MAQAFVKNIYGTKIQNFITCIHEKELNKIAEFNLLHDILNPSKLSKNSYIYDSLILHGCTNTQKGRAKFKNFRIILYSECSYMILMIRMIIKIIPKSEDFMQWHI